MAATVWPFRGGERILMLTMTGTVCSSMGCAGLCLATERKGMDRRASDGRGLEGIGLHRTGPARHGYGLISKAGKGLDGKGMYGIGREKRGQDCRCADGTGMEWQGYCNGLIQNGAERSGWHRTGLDGKGAEWMAKQSNGMVNFNLNNNTTGETQWQKKTQQNCSRGRWTSTH